ncbi:MAG: DUF4348 domain-containing protein [Saprospirales bacterium]|nr:MAG: DUF4348 domain-containing protein [Saprospirales bacterium]
MKSQKNSLTRFALFPYLITGLVVSVVLSSCDLFRKASVTPDSSPESFEEFYLRFHNDPAFQMSRLAFPLEGKLIDAEGEMEWTPENWPVMQVPIWDINDPLFNTDYTKEETKFHQKVWIDNSGFISEYRFELINGQWFLVYAFEQNL